MYSYTFDSVTGGIMLNSTPTNFSKEPRPVYAAEMDILGFDKYWDYDKQNDVPYMWAESNVYWYRGIQIAKTKGGDLYTAPELQPVRDEKGIVPFCAQEGKKLIPIDLAAMCAANEDLMTVIEDSTVKKIVKEYEKFKDKLDIFHVAFSGGKDSAVLLDLVKKALPKGSFVVIFGDTGMEFPDTYEAVKVTKKQCEEDGTPFYVSRSHFDPKDSWELFGPPARVLRWCCSVHKSTPQTLKMREITGKDNYIGMDFVGVRAHESVARSQYEYENFGKKQKGQYSFNPILEWTSAEIWLYIFLNHLSINETYKKGNSRAGCLFCPMGGGASDYFRRNAYADKIDEYVGYIKESYLSSDPKKVNSYITNGGWCARNNGRDLRENKFRCVESTAKGFITITVTTPNEDWKEWIKTLGMLTETVEGYTVRYEGAEIPFKITDTENGYIVSLPARYSVEKPKFSRLFKQVFRKAAYCSACRVCETNCRNGCIKFTNGKLSITNCLHVGLAADEGYRLERKNNQNPNHRHPLVDWNITEAECLRYCYDHGFDWDGLYEIFRRVSCWCCPLQSLPELRKLYRHFPELWEQLKAWDNMTWRKFRADYSVDELEKRFDFEEEWQKAGKSLKSKAFYSALKDRLRGENT